MSNSLNTFEREDIQVHLRYYKKSLKDVRCAIGSMALALKYEPIRSPSAQIYNFPTVIASNYWLHAAQCNVAPLRGGVFKAEGEPTTREHLATVVQY